MTSSTRIPCGGLVESISGDGKETSYLIVFTKLKFIGPNLLLKLVFSRFEVQFLVEMVKLIVKNMRRPIKSSKFWEERLPLNWYVNGSRLCQNKSRIYFFTMKLAQKYTTNLEEIAWHTFHDQTHSSWLLLWRLVWMWQQSPTKTLKDIFSQLF